MHHRENLFHVAEKDVHTRTIQGSPVGGCLS
jgi:hypothetical protein